VGKALAMKELGNPDAALSLLDRALIQDPRSAVGHYYRGLILRDRGRPRDAVIEFERTIELDPAHIEAAIAWSNTTDQLGDPNRALAVAVAVREYHQDDARLAAQIGALHLKLGHLRKAEAELSRAAATLADPVVLGNYGTVQAALGDVNGAARTFERAVELDPKSHEALAMLGQIYMKLSRFNDAEKLLDRAAHLKPDDAQIQFTLGVLYDLQGRLDLAAKQYRTAIEIDDSVGVFYYQLGMVYGRQGKEEKAVDLLEKGRELDPSLPEPSM